MKLILSVTAVRAPLTGIGRYAWELASRMRTMAEIDQVQYFGAGDWVQNPDALLQPVVATTAVVKKRRVKWPKRLQGLHWRWAFHGKVFHTPNYFLPEYAQHGVVTVHDLSVFKYPETHPLERVLHFEKSFRQTLDIAQHLIVDTESTRQEVIDYFAWPAERISAVHLGVSPLFAPRVEAEIAPTLQRYGLLANGYSLCVSTIEPRKRIDSLVAAYARLPDALRRAYPLVLVGADGWCNAHLHDAMRAGQAAGWLHYLGFVDEADLPALYAGAKLFIYPSIYEGFGLPVAEAMAAGVPVVSSNRSCLPETTGGAAKLIDPDDVDAFALGIEAAMTDEAWRLEARARGLQVAARYNWAECAQQTVAAYQKVWHG